MTLRQKFSEHIHFFVSIPAVLWQVLFLWLPLLGLIYLSFTTAGTLNWADLSLREYWELCDRTHLFVILRSLWLAVVNTLLCVSFGYPVAYYLALHLKRAKNLALFLLTLPFWVNFLVHIYAWFFVLERGGLLNRFLLYLGLIKTPCHFMNSFFAILIVMFHVFLPFMITPIYSSLEKFDRSLLESSLDLGASHWQTFWRVTVPLSWHGVRTGVLLVFVISFGEYSVPILLGGSKNLYVGGLVTEYFLLARDMPRGAAFMVLSGLGLILALLLMWGLATILRRGRIST